MTYPITNVTSLDTSHPQFHNAWVDVKAHYAAVGDGVTDDSAAIQDAIDAAGIGVVYFPPGTYKMATGVTFGTRCRIVGAGHDTTRISYTGSGKAFSNSSPGSRIYNVGVEGLTLIGTSSGTHGIEFDSVTDGHVRDVSVTGFSTGIGIRIYSPTGGYSVGNQLSNVIITSCATGLKIDGTASNAQRYFGGKVSSCTTGIYVERSNDNSFYSIDMESNTTAVVLTDPAVGATQWNRFFAPRFEGNTLDVNIATATVRMAMFFSPWTTGTSGMNMTDSGELTLIIGDYVNLLKVPGDIEASGAVKSTRASVALTDGATIAVDASDGDVFTCALGGSRTIAAPTNPTNNQIITFRFLNNTGGAITTTWAAGYFLGAWTDPASTKLRTISFRYVSSSGNWYEVGRSGGDI